MDCPHSVMRCEEYIGQAIEDGVLTMPNCRSYTLLPVYLYATLIPAKVAKG